MDGVGMRGRIGQLMLVKRAVAALPPGTFTDREWPYVPPGPPATQEAIARAEAHVGQRFDPAYRELLGIVDGWACVAAELDLFGVEDHRGGPKQRRVDHVTSILEAGRCFPQRRFRRDELVPIAVDRQECEAVFFVREAAPNAGLLVSVSVFAPDTFDDFDHFFRALSTRNENELGSRRARRLRPPVGA